MVSVESAGPISLPAQRRLVSFCQDLAFVSHIFWYTLFLGVGMQHLV